MMQQLAASSTELATSGKPAANSQDMDKPASEFAAMFEQHQQKKSNSSDTVSPNETRSDKSVAGVKKDSNQPNPTDDTASTDSANVANTEQSEAVKKQDDTVQTGDAATAANKTVADTSNVNDKSANSVAEIDENLAQGEESELESEQLHITWLDLLDKIKAVSQSSEESKTEGSSIEEGSEDGSQSILAQILEKLLAPTSDKQAIGDEQQVAKNKLADKVEGEQQPTDIDTLLSLLNQQQTPAKNLGSADKNTENNELAIKLTDQKSGNIAIINVLAELINTLQGNNSSSETSSNIEGSQLFDSADRVLAFLAGQHGDTVKLLAKSDMSSVKQDITKLTDDMKSLLALPKEQLHKMLDKLATQMLPDTPPEAKQSFIAALQAGLNEIRNQLEKGHEPGLDLQAMIGKAMGELTKKSSELAPASTRQLISPVLDFARMTESSVQPLTSQHIVDDLAIRLGEGGKAVQHNQALDKNSTNLQKMEGIKTLVDKVQLMVNQKSLVADIRIDPPDLGSMQIRLHLGGEQASVSFVVQNQQARDMLDQSLPRLKEMLAEKGIELGQSSVRQEKDQANGGAEQQGSSNGGQFVQEGDDPEVHDGQPTHQLHVTNGALGGIDYFV